MTQFLTLNEMENNFYNRKMINFDFAMFFLYVLHLVKLSMY